MNARQQILVAAAFGLMFVHTLDEAFWHLEEGGVNNLVTVVVTGALVISFGRRLPRLLQVAILGVLGALVLVQGLAGHVLPLLTGSGRPIDVSGILFAAGGAILMLVAARLLAVRRRGPPVAL